MQYPNADNKENRRSEEGRGRRGEGTEGVERKWIDGAAATAYNYRLNTTSEKT